MKRIVVGYYPVQGENIHGLCPRKYIPIDISIQREEIKKIFIENKVCSGDKICLSADVLVDKKIDFKLFFN